MSYKASVGVLGMLIDTHLLQYDITSYSFIILYLTQIEVK